MPVTDVSIFNWTSGLFQITIVDSVLMVKDNIEYVNKEIGSQLVDLPVMALWIETDGNDSFSNVFVKTIGGVIRRKRRRDQNKNLVDVGETSTCVEKRTSTTFTTMLFGRYCK